MKTARKTYLLIGLVCTGLLWAGVAAFGQPDPSPQVPQDSRPSGGVPRAGAGSPAGVGRPGLGSEWDNRVSDPDRTPPDDRAGDPYGGLGAPGVTLRELQQADQQLEVRIQRLVQLYTRAIRGEELKVTETIRESRVQLDNGEQATIQEPYSRALRSEETGEVADPAQIREAIVGLVNKQFQIRQAMRKMEISSLEERVQRLNELLQKREEAQAKIVESRLSQLLNAAEGLGWDNAASSGATSIGRDFFRPAAVSGVPGPMHGSTSAAPPAYNPFSPTTEPAAAAPATPASPRVPPTAR